tara:strand:+ start:6736 stop:8499 length:1764 start_codon:yes stop_codon:yes gene_type:complete
MSIIVKGKSTQVKGKSTQVSPKVVTDGLVFYTDPFNFKSRSRSLPLTGGTIIDLTSSYNFEGTFTDEPEVSNDYKYISFDGTDDYILFPFSSAESIQLQQPFYRYKPKTFTFSAWVKSGTTGGGGVMFFGGGNDFFLKIPALTATTYTPGTYTSVIGENWSATTPTQSSRNLTSFEVTVGSGGTITKAVAESTLAVGGGSLPNNELVIVKLSGDTIGGSTPADDAYLLWRAGTSSQMRWGFGIGDNYGMTIGDSIDRGTFTTDRVSNEPQEWNLITITDVGELVTDNLSCYVNGELVNQDTSTFLNGSQMNPGTINAGQINIGRGGASTFATFLNGSLGPCMMYDKALSQNEILRNYETLKNRFGPIKKLNFNRKSILLDGTDDRIECSSLTAYDNSDFSVSIWVKKTTSGLEYVISNSSASAKAGFDIVINSLNVNFQRRTTTKQAATGYINIGFTYNTWHNLIGTYNDTTGDLKLYLDGVLKNTSSASSDVNTASVDLRIGCSTSNSLFFQGGIDEVSLFNTELSQIDITSIYNSGTPTDLTSYSPLGWWRMGDGDTAPTITDNGSGGNNGTMTNFSTFSIDVPT